MWLFLAIALLLVFAIPSSIAFVYLALGIRLLQIGKREANQQKMASAKTTIINAVFGLFLTVLAFCGVIYLLFRWTL